MSADNLLLVLKALTASVLKTLKIMSKFEVAAGCKVMGENQKYYPDRTVSINVTYFVTFKIK